MFAQMTTQLFLPFLAHFQLIFTHTKFRPLLIWDNMPKINKCSKNQVEIQGNSLQFVEISKEKVVNFEETPVIYHQIDQPQG